MFIYFYLKRLLLKLSEEVINFWIKIKVLEMSWFTVFKNNWLDCLWWKKGVVPEYMPCSESIITVALTQQINSHACVWQLAVVVLFVDLLFFPIVLSTWLFQYWLTWWHRRAAVLLMRLRWFQRCPSQYRQTVSVAFDLRHILNRRKVVCLASEQ